MHRGRDLIGLPVLAGERLRRIGRVREVLLNREADKVCGLVLDEGGWLHPRRVLDAGAVRLAGPTHLLVEEVYLSEEEQTRCCGDLLGLPVLRSTGEELGIMDDFHFDLPGGQVTALQVSRGLVDDLLDGKATIPLSGRLVAGEAAILLDGPVDLSGGAIH